MSNKHMTTYSTIFVIREVQIKTTMRYHLTATGMTTDIPSVWENAEQQELWYIAGGSVKWYNNFGRISASFL